MADLFVVACKMLEIIIAFLGFVLNFYILILISFSRLTVRNSLLSCLSIAHCLFAIIIAVFNLFAFAANYLIEHFGQMCQEWILILFHLQNIFWTIFPLWILWIICLLIVDRYLMVIRPFRYDNKANKCKCIIFLLFVLLLLILFVLPLFVERINQKKVLDLFDFDLSKRVSATHGYSFLVCNVFLILSFLLPASIMIICNIHLLLIITEHRSRIVKTIYVVQLSSHQYSPSVYGNKSKQRDWLATLLNLFCTIILVLPYFVNLLGQLVFHYFDRYLCAISMLIITLTPVVNGYIYGLRSQSVRKAFKRVLQRYLYKCQMSYEFDQREVTRQTANSKTQSISSILQSNKT